MSYKSTRGAVFHGASRCITVATIVVIAGRSMPREDVERAFAEWLEIFGNRALLTFGKDIDGETVVEFTPTGYVTLH
jgi:hypothetical protein